MYELQPLLLLSSKSPRGKIAAQKEMQQLTPQATKHVRTELDFDDTDDTLPEEHSADFGELKYHIVPFLFDVCALCIQSQIYINCAG